MTPLLLAAIGIALALPVPALLARASWPLRAPRAGIIMWQSLALAAILAMSGAGLSTALWLVAVDSPSAWRVGAHVLVLGIGILVWSRFWWATWHVWQDTRHRRARHRALIDLLRSDRPLPDAARDLAQVVRVLEEETPVAYCLPRRRDARVVVSRGTVEALGDDLGAVLEHERSHVRGRHDVVLDAFGILRLAFPRFLRTDAPLHQSRVMVELLADDAARRTHGPLPVARALVALAGSPTPSGALGIGSAATARMARLAEPTPHPRWPAFAAIAISAVVLVVPTVAIAIPWMLQAALTLQK